MPRPSTVLTWCRATNLDGSECGRAGHLRFDVVYLCGQHASKVEKELKWSFIDRAIDRLIPEPELDLEASWPNRR
jgi:hypothetical protein